jgi:hypothetical protein
MPSEARSPSISDRVLVLEEGQERMETTLGEIKRMLSEGADSHKKDIRYAFGVALTVATMVGGPLAYFFNTAVDSKIGPLEASSAASIKDREALLRGQESNMSRVSTLEHDVSVEVATRKAQMVEVETQVASLENTQALSMWHQEVINDILAQNKGVDYPSIPMPQARISNRNVR